MSAYLAEVEHTMMSLRHPERSRRISSVPLHQSVILSLSKDQFSFSFRRMRKFFVHILSNNAQVLYVGVTSDLDGRMFEHARERQPTSFTARYNLDRLVFYETYPAPTDAIAREKQLKGWSREKKKKLIRQMNPMWRNLLEHLRAGTLELSDDM